MRGGRRRAGARLWLYQNDLRPEVGQDPTRLGQPLAHRSRARMPASTLSVMDWPRRQVLRDQVLGPRASEPRLALLVGQASYRMRAGSTVEAGHGELGMSWPIQWRDRRFR